MSIFTIAPCRRLPFSRYVTCCTKLTVRMRDMQMQHGTSDCGLFSIACAVCLCQGEDPCRFSWTQELMRQHLTNCLSTQRMSSFPGNSRKVSAKIKRTIPVVCSCRMPENKMGMAQCTRCEEWFYKKCPRAVFIATWFCKECHCQWFLHSTITEDVV